MSMTCANLRGARMVSGRVSSADIAWLRDEWTAKYEGVRHGQVLTLEPGVTFHPAPLDDDLYALICRGQDRFKAPHLRWDWCHRMPIPFRWGPNGALLLLLAMLAAYGLIVAAINWSAA